MEHNTGFYRLEYTSRLHEDPKINKVYVVKSMTPIVDMSEFSPQTLKRKKRATAKKSYPKKKKIQRLGRKSAWVPKYTGKKPLPQNKIPVQNLPPKNKTSKKKIQFIGRKSAWVPKYTAHKPLPQNKILNNDPVQNLPPKNKTRKTKQKPKNKVVIGRSYYYK